jgi:hypothetical protein
MILIIFDDNDRHDYAPSNPDCDKVSSCPLTPREKFSLFMSIQSLMTIGMCLPAIFLIKDKPPSPPSMVATKERPV